MAEDIGSLRHAIAFAGERNVPLVTMGAGSSLLVRDGGIRGMVVRLGAAFSGIETVREDGDDVVMRVGGAAALDSLGRAFAERGVKGANCLNGMRATVAGSMIAMPQLLADAVEEVYVVDRGGRELALARKALMQNGTFRVGRGAVIVAAVLRASRIAAPAFAAECGPPRSSRALGPVFADIGRQRAAGIIAEAGLAGIRVGRVRVDPKDANCFVNEGGAQAAHAVVLMGMIRELVRQHAGLMLESAIRVVGEK